MHNRQERITTSPGVRRGRACIRDTRIAVVDIFEYMASGMSERQILDDFPDLTPEDLRACLVYAADRERKLPAAPL